MYTNISSHFGVEIPYLGAVWSASLAGLSLLVPESAPRKKTHLYFFIISAGSFVAIQILYFHLSWQDQYVKPFILVIFMAIVVDKLLLKPNFLKHMVIFMCIQALLIWPFITWEGAGKGMFRARAEGTSFANPNNFGAWLGFCSLGLWVWGLQQSGQRWRWLCRGGWIFFFALMLQTITRGALLALAAGLLVSLLRVKMRYRLGLFFLLLVLTVAGLQLPTIGERIEDYRERGWEETGRLQALPVALADIWESPWLGIGAEQVVLYVPGIGKMPPHNGFLFLWAAGGILPLLLFMMLLSWSWARSYRWSQASNPQMFDPLPLLAFVCIEIGVTDLILTHFWALAVIFFCFHMTDQKGLEGTYFPYPFRKRFLPQ